MKMRLIKKLISITSALVILSTTISSAEVLVPGGIDSLYNDDGPGFATEIVVAGDSYAQRFYEDERDRGINLIGYFNAGFTLDMNWSTLLEAFNSLNKIIFFSVSINDRHKNTHPSEFEREFRTLLDIADRTGKIVFVHSYMYYDLASVPIFSYTTSEYDAMIRKIVQEYKNVYYIDMSDCIGSEYMQEDGLHYNKKFNDIMFDRMNFLIDLLKSGVL